MLKNSLCNMISSPFDATGYQRTAVLSWGGGAFSQVTLCVCVCACSMVQTCSTGVSAQGGGPLQGGHRGRAAQGRLAVLHAGGPRAGVTGVRESRRGQGESGGEGGGGGGGRGRSGEGDLGAIFARLFLEDGELRAEEKDKRSFIRPALSQDPAQPCVTLPDYKQWIGGA